ncbi:MAG: RHS repeat-associated core domain-containing protein [Acidobacteriota bacterium]|nr:RHS repeat-associated core domain-containing protein [Acidobacteriota bacterium]
MSSWSYDAAERLTSMADAAGNVVELTLDAAGNPRTVTRRETVPDGPPEVVTEDFVYDAAGRRIEARDGLDNRTRTTYDARDQARLVRDAEGYSTSLTYDGLDRLTRVERPEGILEIFEYDAAGRPTGYVDALDQRTTYAYDALDRVTSVTYPDLTQRQMTYEGADLLATLTDANGTVVTQAHDAAGRLTGRSVALGTGVLGPTTETYAYDSLNRLVQTTSGPTPNGTVTTTLTYDSLGRVLTETGPAGTVGYQRDTVGNAVELSYPSGLTLGRIPDPLNRLQVVGPKSGGVLTPQATYGYRGVDLVAGLELGNGLSGIWSYDGARRPVSVSFTGASGQSPFDERLGWSPRGLRTASQRADLGRTGELFATDGAGRLVTAARQRDAMAQLPSNSPLSAGDLTPQASFSTYQYDTAQNLTARQVVQAAPLKEQNLPPDESSRNRPASVGSKALTWDANGNLTSKGDLTFEYDFRNRLTRVSLSGVELAYYEYDTFNRRVRIQRSQDSLREVVWSGWQELEETLGGQLWQRRTYGRSLDELVRLEGDLNLDGVLETDYAPLYDRSGNLVVLTGAQGQPVAKYAYSPFGDTMAAHVDATPSQVHQVLFKAGELWLEFSEEVLTEPFFEAVTSGEVYLQESASGTHHSLLALFPVADGRQAHHRVVLTPETVPTAGVEVALVVGEEAVRDHFDNEPAAPYSLTFDWPAAGTTTQLLEDSAAPEVEQVYLRDSYLEIEISESVDLAAAAQSILVDGAPISWTLGEDGYTLRSVSPLAAGNHTVEVTTGPLDLAGQGLATAFTTTASVATSATSEQLYTRPSTTEVEFAALGNFFSYHGRPLDVDTGLLYFRNRYYDPELGRFITADPLGYVDGPSQYLFAMNSPVVFGDPLGLYRGSREEQAWVREDLAVASAQRAREAQQAEFNAVSTFLAGVDPDYNLREELGLYFNSQGLGLGRVSSKVQQYLGPAGTCQGAIQELHCGIADAWPEVELLEYTTVEVTALLLGGVEASAAVSSSGLSRMAARSSRSVASRSSRRLTTGNFAHHGLEFLDDGVRMAPNAGRQVVPRGAARFPERPGQVQHIFRDAPGHLADTPASRKLLQGIADDVSTTLGTDRFGNVWSARTLDDGTQMWVQTRNGVIQNGGLNQMPRVFNPETGLSGQ